MSSNKVRLKRMFIPLHLETVALGMTGLGRQFAVTSLGAAQPPILNGSVSATGVNENIAAYFAFALPEDLVPDTDMFLESTQRVPTQWGNTSHTENASMWTLDGQGAFNSSDMITDTGTSFANNSWGTVRHHIKSAGIVSPGEGVLLQIAAAVNDTGGTGPFAPDHQVGDVTIFYYGYD